MDKENESPSANLYIYFQKQKENLKKVNNITIKDKVVSIS